MLPTGLTQAEAIYSRFGLPKALRKRQVKVHIRSSFEGNGEIMAKPERDEEFEKFLSEKVEKLVVSTLLVARRAFYGTHYDRLFPDVPKLMSDDCGPRQLRLRVMVEALEIGQDWCALFLQGKPKAREPYLVSSSNKQKGSTRPLKEPRPRLPFNENVFSRAIQGLQPQPNAEMVQKARDWLTEIREYAPRRNVQPDEYPPLPDPDELGEVNRIVRAYLLSYEPPED